MKISQSKLNGLEYTVLMSVYKKEKPEFLIQSIESIVNQTVTPNEFLIVKDGKVGKALDDVLNKYAKSFKYIKVVSFAKNRGLGPALADGVKLSKNELIVRMDSDDISRKDRCEELLSCHLNNPSLDVIGSNVTEFMGEQENIISERLMPETHNGIVVFSRKRNPFAHPSILLKKSSVISAGNYRDYSLCEDYDLWVRMIRNGAKGYNIQKNLVNMRLSPDFYKRRGGWAYVKKVVKFKKELLHVGHYSISEFIVSALSTVLVGLFPNQLRKIIYNRILRNRIGQIDLNNRIRVGVITPSFRPVGPVNVALDIARNSNVDNCEITMISLRQNRKENKNKISEIGLNNIEFNFGKVPSITDINRLRKYIKQFDIIHTHSFWPTVIVGLFKAKKITTVHSNPKQDFVNEYGILIGYLMVLAYFFSIRQYSKVVCVSKYVQENIPTDNTVIIYNGVKDMHKLRIRKKIKKNSIINLLCVSSLTKTKNLFELIDLLEYCKTSGLNFKCMIVGEGKLRKELSKYILLKRLTGEVTLMGQLSKKEVNELFTESDCLVHTSFSEGFGLAVVEAEMFGLPVIVKSIPTMYEIVEHSVTGYIYKTKEDFYKYLEGISENQETKDILSSNARSLYRERFTDKIMSDRYIEEYLLILKGMA